MAVGKNFVVKNGLEVNELLLYADAVTDQVGINTSIPDYDLHVLSSIGCTDLTVTRNATVSGILTANELDFTGNGISIGDTTGLPGQYLRSTGSGVEWASFPTSLRSTFTYTATNDQTTFAYAYNVGFLDVYINGVKLKGNGVSDITEYTASNGTSVTVTEPCFEGDTVELVAYNPSAIAAGGNGVLGFTIQEEGVIVGNDNGVASINFVGASVTAVGSGAGVTVYIEGTAGTAFTGAASTITTTNISNWNTAYGWGNHATQGYLTTYNETDTLQDVLDRGNTASSDVIISGIVTATKFIGDGSGLIGVVGSGSGIVIRDSGVLVGTAGTIDFGNNITVSPISLGIVTVTASGSGGDSYWASTAAGIHTLSNVGMGTTNPTSKLTVKGNTSLETLNVSGVSTLSGTVTFGGATEILSSGEVKLDNLSRIMLGYSGGTPNGLVIRQNSSSDVSEIVNVGGDDIQIQADSGRSVFIGNDNTTNSLSITGTGVTVLSTLNVGSNTTAVTPFQLENIYGVKTGIGTFISSAGIGHTIDSFTISTSDFKTIEYTIHVGYGTYIQSQKILAMQNGSSAYSQEYAIMYDPSLIVSVGSTVTGGQFRLILTPEVGVSGLTTYRFTRQTML
jgi:hypothetical protein